jgi:pimeloyl-ACP methyl ester carboxylesterase
MTTLEQDTTRRIAQLDEHRATLSTSRCEISYLDVGPRSGPPAVFVHGVGVNAFLWRNVIAEVSSEKRCIALDLPVHGHSGIPTDDDLSMGALADTIAEFVAKLDLGPVDLVAHDTGGGLAQIVAGRRPELLRTFALTNCETHDNVPPEAFKPTVEAAKAGALAPGADALLTDLSAARAAVFGASFEDPDQPDLAIVEAYLRPLLASPERARAFERLLAGLEPSALLEVEPALRRLRVPTLVVWGTNDEFFDVKWAHWLRDTIPGVTEVVEIEGAKLFFPDERGAELAMHLTKHWSRV